MQTSPHLAYGKPYVRARHNQSQPFFRDSKRETIFVKVCKHTFTNLLKLSTFKYSLLSAKKMFNSQAQRPGFHTRHHLHRYVQSCK